MIVLTFLYDEPSGTIVNNVLCYFQKQCSAVKYWLFQAYCSIASVVASYGICHVISWLIFALHGGRELCEFGMFRQTHT